MTSPTDTGRPPSAPEGGRPRRATGLPLAAAALATAAGLAMTTVATWELLSRPHPRAEGDIGVLPAPPATSAPAPAPSAAPPTRIRIAGLALDDPLTRLDVQQDGHLAAPQDPRQVGWWSDGPRPGDQGAAVIVGHVDSLTGPAAFYNISSLRPGDTITIDRADRTRVVFTVRALRLYPKDHFPDNQVYATTGPPSLRLVTCGGAYVHDQGGYRDNVVVYATLTTRAGTPPPHPPDPTTPTRSTN